MKLALKAVLVLAFCATSAYAKLRDSFSLVPLQFKYHGISPKYVETAPKEMCQLKWSSGASANLGKKLAPSDMSDEPSVSWLCDPHEKYSAFLFALDVLGKDNDLLDEGRLWFVANITNCDWRNSEIVVDYLPPTPLHDTGEHRYVFLVYKQPCGMYYEEPFVESNEVEHRFYTTMQKFAIKYGLGRPVCGNFFLSEWDSCVDETFADLKKPFPAYFERALDEEDDDNKNRHCS